MAFLDKCNCSIWINVTALSVYPPSILVIVDVPMEQAAFRFSCIVFKLVPRI